MTVHNDIFVSDGAVPGFPLAGAGLSEKASTPRLKASSIAETIDLGRRVLELADKLGSATDRRRAPSFRLLAKQLVVPKGASSVWRAAAIYRLAERYPELNGYQHLGVGHLAVLLSLRGPVQLALLRKAERMRWSRRKLEAKVKRIIEDSARGVDSLAPLLAELETDAPEHGSDATELAPSAVEANTMSSDAVSSEAVSSEALAANVVPSNVAPSNVVAPAAPAA
jgi:hypothetical protein